MGNRRQFTHSARRRVGAFAAVMILWLPGACSSPELARGEESGDAPNVLFISVDDLNDWIGCMGGHPQARTPNLDRLANSGVLFTNAHCPAPACNPSRASIMTGISPHVSGVYDNRQKMREVMPEEVLIPKYFTQNGYWSAGSGKILHYFTDADSWDDYFPPKETENPFPSTKYPDERPLSLPRGGDWQYLETDWGPLDVTDEEFGGDYLVAEWIGKELGKEHPTPFFLACGIYRPHEPWFVPKKYLDLFPLEDIQAPPGYREGDLEDLSPEAQRRGRNRYFDHIQWTSSRFARWGRDSPSEPSSGGGSSPTGRAQGNCGWSPTSKAACSATS